MSINHVSNGEVIPEIESRIFEGHEASRLAVGIVAVGSQIMPGRENEYWGYADLRANVYARQRAYMSVEELNADGTEIDVDDARSVHFVLLENVGTVGLARVVGAKRLIIKSPGNDQPLPIEEHFPEAFSAGPAPMLSTEVSRLIARHEDPAVQSTLKWPLFAAGTTFINDHNLGPVYGVVEKSLARGLQMANVPVTPLADAKHIPEINSVKMPIRIDMTEMNKNMDGERPGLLASMQALKQDYVYSGVMPVPVSMSSEATSVAVSAVA